MFLNFVSTFKKLLQYAFGSYISARAFLNSLNKLRYEIKCEACQVFYLIISMSLINSNLQKHEFYSLFKIIIRHKMSFEIPILAKNVKILS